MLEAALLSDAIAAIYDTTLDPSGWIAAIEKTATFVGGKAGTLALHDTASATGNLAYTWGDDPRLTDHYIANLARINPLMVPAHLHLQPGEVFSASQLIPYDEFRRSRVFTEWAEPQGWGDFTHLVIEKSGSRFSHFGVANGAKESPAGEDVRRRLRLLAPHVMRAVAISKALELHRVQAETLSSAVDSLAAAVFLVGDDGVIVYANVRAREMLADGAILRDSNGALSAVDANARAELRDAIASPVGGVNVEDRDKVAIALRGPLGERFVAHVVSLRSGARREAGRLYGAAAGVFVHQAELQRPSLIQTVTKRFKLTRAESRVLFAIVEVGGVAETAAALGLAEETVKTHLKRLFRKTGASRQAELVKCIAEFANPMVG